MSTFNSKQSNQQRNLYNFKHFFKEILILKNVRCFPFNGTAWMHNIWSRYDIIICILSFCVDFFYCIYYIWYNIAATHYTTIKNRNRRRNEQTTFVKGYDLKLNVTDHKNKTSIQAPKPTNNNNSNVKSNVNSISTLKPVKTTSIVNQANNNNHDNTNNNNNENLSLKYGKNREIYSHLNLENNDIIFNRLIEYGFETSHDIAAMQPWQLRILKKEIPRIDAIYCIAFKNYGKYEYFNESFNKQYKQFVDPSVWLELNEIELVYQGFDPTIKQYRCFICKDSHGLDCIDKLRWHLFIQHKQILLPAIKSKIYKNKHNNNVFNNNNNNTPWNGYYHGNTKSKPINIIDSSSDDDIDNNKINSTQNNKKKKLKNGKKILINKQKNNNIYNKKLTNIANNNNINEIISDSDMEYKKNSDINVVSQPIIEPNINLFNGYDNYNNYGYNYENSRKRIRFDDNNTNDINTFGNFNFNQNGFNLETDFDNMSFHSFSLGNKNSNTNNTNNNTNFSNNLDDSVNFPNEELHWSDQFNPQISQPSMNDLPSLPSLYHNNSNDMDIFMNIDNNPPPNQPINVSVSM